MTKPKIYLASKLHHSELARMFVKDNTFDVTWTNRWQWFEGEVKDAEDFAAHFWENDFDDVDAADYVIVYGTKKRHTKRRACRSGLRHSTR